MSDEPVPLMPGVNLGEKPQKVDPATLPENDQSLTPRQRYLARKERIAQSHKERIAKAHAAKALKKQQRDLVKEKIQMGLPITKEEEDLVNWSATASRKKNEERVVDAAARLVIKPQHVNELRIVVERTAAKHKYNPVEALILLAAGDELEPKERAAVHKSLLPFLVPTLPPSKPTKEGSENEGQVKVTITQFVFKEDQHEKPVIALHNEMPKTAQMSKE